MSGLNNPVFYAALMLVVGLGIPKFAALNGELGTRLQSPALAATIALSAGLVISVGFLLLSGGMPAPDPQSSIPLYSYLGGLLLMAIGVILSVRR